MMATCSMASRSGASVSLWEPWSEHYWFLKSILGLTSPWIDFRTERQPPEELFTMSANWEKFEPILREKLNFRPWLFNIWKEGVTKDDFTIPKRHYQTIKPVKMKCWWEPIKPHKHISLPAACLSETIWYMIWINLI